MALNEKTVLEALGTVQDPDLGKDLVTLGMIKDLNLSGDAVAFELELTTPACPLREQLKQACIDAVQQAVGPVPVNVTLTSNVTSRRSSHINILPNVKNIICVASGKGGVGKSTVAVNLAVALAKTGAKVGLLDADIHGPSIPLMMGLKQVRPQVREIKGKHYLLPPEKYGVKCLSIGFVVDERQAVVWRGPMVTSALRQFVTDTLWGRLDYMIMDLPPGTGDIHLTMVQTVPVTGAIVVTTPQDVALADAQKAIAMFRMEKIQVPLVGLVQNMAYFSPPDRPDEKHYLFGKDGGRSLAESYEIPFLGEVPIVQAIREGGDTGNPAALEDSDAAAVYSSLAEAAARQVAIRNASLPPTRPVEMMQQ